MGFGVRLKKKQELNGGSHYLEVLDSGWLTGRDEEGSRGLKQGKREKI